MIEVPGGMLYVSQAGSIYSREGVLLAACGTVEAAKKLIKLNHDALKKIEEVGIPDHLRIKEGKA